MKTCTILPSKSKQNLQYDYEKRKKINMINSKRKDHA